MTEYIFSDTHFGHKNICGPKGFEKGRKMFDSVTEMNDCLIRNFNKVVTAADVTYHLGDIAIGLKPADVHKLLSSMNGAFIIVRGNHDDSKLVKYLTANNFKLPTGRNKYEIHDVGIRIKARKKVYVLSHYPMGLGAQRAGIRNLCGHIHGTATKDPNLLNVGIDSPEIDSLVFGAPISLEQAMDVLEAKWEKHVAAEEFKKTGEGYHDSLVETTRNNRDEKLGITLGDKAIIEAALVKVKQQVEYAASQGLEYVSISIDTRSSRYEPDTLRALYYLVERHTGYNELVAFNSMLKSWFPEPIYTKVHCRPKSSYDRELKIVVLWGKTAEVKRAKEAAEEAARLKEVEERKKHEAQLNMDLVESIDERETIQVSTSVQVTLTKEEPKSESHCCLKSIWNNWLGR